MAYASEKEQAEAYKKSRANTRKLLNELTDNGQISGWDEDVEVTDLGNEKGTGFFFVRSLWGEEWRFNTLSAKCFVAGVMSELYRQEKISSKTIYPRTRGLPYSQDFLNKVKTGTLPENVRKFLNKELVD
jgi:hypothetical protein